MAWSYWVEFEGGTSACVEVDGDFVQGLGLPLIGGREEPILAEARRRAEEIRGQKVVGCDIIPYPADPRLNPIPHPKYGPTPSFCYTPRECRGCSSCPKRRACDD